MKSTYNKELGNAIKNSNTEFRKEQYKLDHKASAAKLSLYYAHGNTEKNENNFKNVKADSQSAELINKKAVKGANLSENVVIAAKQSLLDSSSATSNVSTAAANMQIAANAINKLASDVAALNSIAKNANHESKIQLHTERANEKIQNAARLAEDVSLDSMQATIEASQATASTVVTSAEATLQSMKNLLSATASNYSNLSEQLVSVNSDLTEARKNEKLASANLDVSNKQDRAIKSTRKTINKVSNHTIQLVDTVNWSKKEAKKNKMTIITPAGISEGDSYTIMFDAYDHENQIQNYRLIMVKYDDSDAFDINIAHDLEPGTFFQFAPSDHKIYQNTFYLLDADLNVLPTGETKIVTVPDKVTGKVIEKYKEFRDVRNHIMVDYKGKPIERGVPYVAYVYVVYKPKYQNNLDSTIGYLSLPSEDLTLQKILYSTQTPTVHQPYFNSRNISVSLKVPTKDYDPDMIDFRIMMLESSNVKANAVNKAIAKRIDELEQAEFKYNASANRLALLTAQFNEANMRLNSLENQIRTYNPNVDIDVKLSDLTKEKSQVITDRTQLEDIIYGVVDKSGKRSGGLNHKVATDKANYLQAIQLEAGESKKKISDFIFDTDLMGQVAASDYKIATPIKWDFDTASAQLLENMLESVALRIKLVELVKTVYLEEGEGKNPTSNHTRAMEQVLLAEAKIQTIESELEDLINKQKNLLKQKNVSEQDLDKAEKDVVLKEESLTKAVQELNDKEMVLNDAERAMLVFESLQAERRDNLSSLINDFIQSQFDVMRTEEILFMLDKDWKLDEILKILGYKVEKGKLVRIHTDASDQKTEDKSKEKPKKLTPAEVILFTEMGEDATDNYGEPLFLNQKNYLEQAIESFEMAINKLSKSKKSESEIDEQLNKEIDKLNQKEILEKYGKEAASDISYQAIVYSALSPEFAAYNNANEYMPSHSSYSNAVTLYQVTQ